LPRRSPGEAPRVATLTRPKITAAAPSEEEAALEARLLAAVARRKAPVAAEDLLRAARLSTADKRPSGEERLAALEARGALVRTKGDRFTLPARLDLVAGRLQSNPAGYAFCVTDDPDDEDVYLPASGVRPAMHGDRVLVRVERFQRRGRTEGRVVRVLERGTSRVIGVLRRGRTSAVVVPQEQRITVPIVVPRGADGGAADGDMVVAELTRYPSLASEAEARVIAVLGRATDPRVETEAVIAAHDLPREFPPEVAAAARRVPASVPASAMAGRLDLRGLPIVTIDGENARDSPTRRSARRWSTAARGCAPPSARWSSRSSAPRHWRACSWRAAASGAPSTSTSPRPRWSSTSAAGPQTSCAPSARSRIN